MLKNRKKIKIIDFLKYLSPFNHRVKKYFLNIFFSFNQIKKCKRRKL